MFFKDIGYYSAFIDIQKAFFRTRCCSPSPAATSLPPAPSAQTQSCETNTILCETNTKLFKTNTKSYATNKELCETNTKSCETNIKIYKRNADHTRKIYIHILERQTQTHLSQFIESIMWKR